MALLLTIVEGFSEIPEIEKSTCAARRFQNILELSLHDPHPKKTITRTIIPDLAGCDLFA